MAQTQTDHERYEVLEVIGQWTTHGRAQRLIKYRTRSLWYHKKS